MDNFEKLFNESRRFPAQEKYTFPTMKDLQIMDDSEWMNFLSLGIKSYEDNNYPLALTYLNKSIDIERKNQHIYYVRANIKEDAGDPQGAILDYKEGLNIGGNDWYSIYNQIAVNYLNLKNFTQALIAFDIAIELKNKITSQNMDETIMPYVIDGVAMKVDYERIYSNRANAKFNLKDFHGCLDDCNKAIKANPSYSNSYLLVGILLAQVGKMEQSLDALRKAHERGNPNAENAIRQLHGK